MREKRPHIQNGRQNFARHYSNILTKKREDGGYQNHRYNFIFMRKGMPFKWCPFSLHDRGF